jgi:hypothetical protein
MKYKKFLLLPLAFLLYLIFINSVAINYEIQGTSYSVSKGSGSTNEQIATSHQLEVIVKRHRILYFFPSYGFRSIGFARGNLIMYNPGPLKDFHLYFLIFFTILAIILVFLEIKSRQCNQEILIET